MGMRLAIMLGYPFENTLLRRRVCYTIDRHIVVEGEKDAASLYAATDSRMTRPHLRCGNHIRTGSSLVESGALAQAICACLDKLHGEDEKGVDDSQRDSNCESITH